MIMPQWFVTALIVLSSVAMAGNIVFLITTIIKEKKDGNVW